MTLTGSKAIASGKPLWKYADEIDGARAVDAAEAREIAAVDPSLIYAKECTHHDCKERCVMVWNVYHQNKSIAVFASVEDARAFAASSGLEVEVGDCALPGTHPQSADSFWRGGVQVYPHLGE